MKKCYFVAIVLVLMTVLSCCASPSHGEPPRVIYFSSVESVQDYITVASLSDDQFTAFLQSNLKDSSPSTQADAQAFVKVWNQLDIPVYTSKNDDVEFYLSYRPDQGSVDIKYRIEGIQYRFVYQKSAESGGHGIRKPVAEYAVDGKIIPLYQGDDRLFGEIYDDGYCVTVIVHAYEDAVKLEPEKLVLPDFSWSRGIENMNE